jgi:DNA-binding IclR family transcriptional regulator
MLSVTKEATPPTTRPIASATKLLALLEVVSEFSTPVRVSELARRVGVSRAEVHRQLVTLVKAGWMEQAENGAYHLSFKPIYLGQAALAQAGLGVRVLPIMQRLVHEVSEVVSLAVLDRRSARIVQRVEPRRALQAYLSVGSALSLAQSASGRVLLAFSDAEIVGRLRSTGLALPSDEELAAIRTAGFASSIGDEVDEVTAVAVPVRTLERSSVAALSVVGPVGRFDRQLITGALLGAATDIDRLVSNAPMES